MRAIGACLALVVAFPAVAAAQWNVTLQGGIHLDRVTRPEQVYRSSSSWGAGVAYSGQGNASTIGLRATRSLTGHLAADLGLAVAQNRAWFGSSVGGKQPLKLTAFAGAAPAFRVYGPDSRLQVQVGAGPALVLHGGNGESLLTRNVDPGFTAFGDVGFRLGRRLQVVVGAQNYRFTSRFRDELSFPSTPVYRSEWLVLSGIRLEL